MSVSPAPPTGSTRRRRLVVAVVAILAIAGIGVAVASRGRGLLDVAFVNFLPGEFFPQRGPQKLDAVVVLEQVEPGKFIRRAHEVTTCNHLTCVAGDIDGDGKPELVVGNFVRGGEAGDAIAIWRNTTTGPKK